MACAGDWSRYSGSPDAANSQRNEEDVVEIAHTFEAARGRRCRSRGEPSWQSERASSLRTSLLEPGEARAFSRRHAWRSAASIGGSGP